VERIFLPSYLRQGQLSATELILLSPDLGPTGSIQPAERGSQLRQSDSGHNEVFRGAVPESRAPGSGRRFGATANSHDPTNTRLDDHWLIGAEYVVMAVDVDISDVGALRCPSDLRGIPALQLRALFLALAFDVDAPHERKP
jgi:hypothetical protein